MKKVLVLGGSGFIGYNLCKYLSNKVFSHRHISNKKISSKKIKFIKLNLENFRFKK